MSFFDESDYFTGIDEKQEKTKKEYYKEICGDGCQNEMPDVLKERITNRVSPEDSGYYCALCEFIRKTGISEQLSEEMKKTNDAHSEITDYEEGLDAIVELEDSGAFSDEGLMPGCHSYHSRYDSEIEGINKEFEEMEFEGKCIYLARKKTGIKKEELAKQLELPEELIDHIENGQYVKYGGSIEISSITPVPVPCNDSFEKNETKEIKKWWEKASDEEVKEKVMAYLMNNI